ncbi:uncharacterized protein LOC113508546 [Trichoplusia ni]|uniref:Uncharacterized protein LOC113508546 n=1 Tax=Trichoplusia ni TaxID=7111 RepID=A0A7E5X4S2_TRINI|nr:uncharacterized protein LOC113508546 [Trichoplusia ni]
MKRSYPESMERQNDQTGESIPANQRNNNESEDSDDEPQQELLNNVIFDRNTEVEIFWPNASEHITNLLKEALKNPALTDCALACDQRTLKAHKIVLGASSFYFNCIFQAAPNEQSNFYFSDVRFEVLRDFVNYFYTGNLKIPKQNFDEYFAFAKRIAVKGLVLKPSRELSKLRYQIPPPKLTYNPPALPRPQPSETLNQEPAVPSSENRVPEPPIEKNQSPEPSSVTNQRCSSPCLGDMRPRAPSFVNTDIDPYADPVPGPSRIENPTPGTSYVADPVPGPSHVLNPLPGRSYEDYAQPGPSWADYPPRASFWSDYARPVPLDLRASNAEISSPRITEIIEISDDED